MKIPSGYPFYGQSIGILVFRTQSARIPGDPGHAATFPYPVRYQVVEGGFGDLVEGSEAIRSAIRDAGLALKAEGIRAVLGDCGLMSLYQQEMGREWGIPFAASSLCQIPAVWQMVGCAGVIGVITGHSGYLTGRHLSASGCDRIPVAVQGMEAQSHFAATVIGGSPSLAPALLEQEVLAAGRLLRQAHPTLRAVVLECSNLGTYSAALGEALQLPVFDILSAAALLNHSVCPPRF